MKDLTSLLVAKNNEHFSNWFVDEVNEDLKSKGIGIIRFLNLLVKKDINEFRNNLEIESLAKNYLFDSIYRSSFKNIDNAKNKKIGLFHKNFDEYKELFEYQWILNGGLISNVRFIFTTSFCDSCLDYRFNKLICSIFTKSTNLSKSFDENVKNTIKFVEKSIENIKSSKLRNDFIIEDNSLYNYIGKKFKCKISCNFKNLYQGRIVNCTEGDILYQNFDYNNINLWPKISTCFKNTDDSKMNIIESNIFYNSNMFQKYTGTSKYKVINVRSVDSWNVKIKKSPSWVVLECEIIGFYKNKEALIYQEPNYHSYKNSKIEFKGRCFFVPASIIKQYISLETEFSNE